MAIELLQEISRRQWYFRALELEVELKLQLFSSLELELKIFS